MEQLCLWNSALIAPNIVLSGKWAVLKHQTRRGALVCLRDDIEGILSSEDKKLVLDLCAKFFSDVNEVDTFESNLPQSYERTAILHKKLLQFSTAEIVITDRLHSMIFSVLSGTPCIVFNNNNGKVKAVYDWISYLDNIVFLDTVSALSEMLKCAEMKCNQFDCDTIADYYSNLKLLLKV